MPLGKRGNQIIVQVNIIIVLFIHHSIYRSLKWRDVVQTLDLVISCYFSQL